MELACRSADVRIVVDESEHAGFRVAVEPGGYFSEGFPVECGVVFFVGEYGVVTPDDFFFSYFFR